MSEKLHTIDGVTYREVARKAEVGEKIVTVSYKGARLMPGDITAVSRAKYYDGSVRTECGAFFDTEIGDKYRVLEPVADAEPVHPCDKCGKALGEICCKNEKGGRYCSAKCADSAPQSSDDIIANLVCRVARLEDELDAVRKNVQTFAEQTEANTNDIALLDERTMEYPAPAATKADRLAALCDELKSTLIRKNHDYGDSFAKQYDKHGMTTILIRLEDKMSRLETLAGGEQAQVDESIEDTLLDIAGYGILALEAVSRGAHLSGASNPTRSNA